MQFTADQYLNNVVLEWLPEESLGTTISYLKFLSRPEFEQDWCSEGERSVLKLQNRYPFHGYAARNWHTYIRFETDPEITKLAMEFLSNKALVSTASLALAVADSKFCTEEQTVDPRLTALHVAALADVEALLLRLVQDHVYMDIDAQDYLGRTPLWLAAVGGRLQAVSALLDAGASPDIADKSGWTPLLVAIERSNDSVVEVLVDHPSRPADVNLSGSGEGFPAGEASPLMVAVSIHDWHAMQVLLRRSDLAINTELDGNTALTCCATKGQVKSAMLLLDHPQCEINKIIAGATALHRASIEGHAEMIDILISRGANVEHPDDWGRTPLHLAILHGCYEAVWSLLQGRASLDAEDESGRGVLHYAASADNIQILKLLLSYDGVHALMDARDRYGDTPLRSAFRWGHAHHRAILVAFGANVDLAGQDGKSPRQLAQDKSIDLFAEMRELENRDDDVTWMADVLLAKPKKGKDETKIPESSDPAIEAGDTPPPKYEAITGYRTTIDAGACPRSIELS